MVRYRRYLTGAQTAFHPSAENAGRAARAIYTLLIGEEMLGRWMQERGGDICPGVAAFVWATYHT